jgi:hypothetical protein
VDGSDCTYSGGERRAVPVLPRDWDECVGPPVRVGELHEGIPPDCDRKHEQGKFALVFCVIIAHRLARWG